MRDPKRGRLAKLLDEIFDAFAPRRAFHRRAARFASEYAFGYSGGGYTGAKNKRTTADWIPGSGSADADILLDLDDLRDRSRDLIRNDAHAHGIVGTMQSNVIGSGIKPQSIIDGSRIGLDEDATEEARRISEKIFDRWSSYADATGRLDFYEMQGIAFRQILENGEVFLLRRMIEDSTRPYSFAWEIIEADRIDTPAQKITTGNIRSGIELSANGTPIAYHVRTTHPGDYPISGQLRTNSDAKFVRVSAIDDDGRPNVIHLYFAERPGQTRGVPLLAPILMLFRHLGSYIEAKVMKERITAAISLWIETPDAIPVATLRSTGTDASGKRTEGLQPGQIKYLNPGQKMNAFNPTAPAGDFADFVNRIIQMMSASVGLSYELSSKDFSNVNYSSARASLQQSYRMFRTHQAWIARKLCTPTWKLVLEEAILRGDLPVAGNFIRDFHEWTAVRWISPGWEWIDPLKEAQASKIAVQYGFSSTMDENSSRGKDWEETIEQEARVRRKREEEGLQDPFAEQQAGG